MNSPLAFSPLHQNYHTSARHRVCSDEMPGAQRRGLDSELVALSAPVEPVFDRLSSFVISIEHFKLGERNRQTFPIPAHYDEHLMLAFLFGRHADHLDLVSYLQGGDGSSGSTPGEKGEVELPFKIVVPTHSPFLFVVGIDDDLHIDPMLSGFVRFNLRCSKPLHHSKPLHFPGPSPRTIDTQAWPHNLRNVGYKKPFKHQVVDHALPSALFLG